MTNRDRLRERLKWYGPVEIFNAVLVPAVMVGWCLLEQQPIGLLLLITCIPMCALLVIGGLYWRAKLKQLDGDKSELESVLAFASRVQRPLEAFCLIAVIASLAGWFVPGFGQSFGERLAASFASLMAVLEYVNYYHRQLQHFDHGPDFERLMRGKGFGRSQMAHDLAKWKSGKLARTR